MVERPASVVKELVENSLDAGASQVDIDIDKGGHKRICVRDNGCGICKEELGLALSRHATSKITSLDDLEQIMSLGFRGEALASVSSVARLNLTSKTALQTEAWQARAEGRDMEVELLPAAHPEGTSVEVLDLFFNTPARRKFLRAEKTEFNHIEEVVRRIALSRFDVGFSLKHNGKLVKKFPAINLDGASEKRITGVCGKSFSDVSIQISSQYQHMTLTGWLAAPGGERNQNDLQYFYVNGRVMRDKLINHAIRQAFEGLISADSYPAYILYLELPPNEVDVNVHPAKHEVRFHQARLVHDFIFRAINDGLQQTLVNDDSPQSLEVSHISQPQPNHDYIKPLQPNSGHVQRIGETTKGPTYSGSHRSQPVSATAASNYQHLMSADTKYDAMNLSWWLVGKTHYLINSEQQFYRLAVQKIHKKKLIREFGKSVPTRQPLLMPVSLAADKKTLTKAQNLFEPLAAYSVEIGWTENRIVLRKVPAGLRNIPWTQVFPGILENIDSEEPVLEPLMDEIVSGITEYSQQQAEDIWIGLSSEFLDDWKQNVLSWSQKVDLERWLLTHE